MTNALAILSLILNTNNVTIQYTAPVGELVFFDAKHDADTDWTHMDYGVAVANSATATNTLKMRVPFPDRAFFRLRIIPPALALQRPTQTPPDNEGPQRNIPIKGYWDEWNPDQFRTDAALDRSRSYTISNQTTNAITVMLVEITWDEIAQAYGRTPRDYFPLLPGYTQQFAAPGHMNPDSETFSLDLFLRGYEGDRVKCIVLREVGPEFATD